MNINFDDTARPVVWLIRGFVEHDSDDYRFWYQYDERDGEVLYEFDGTDPDESNVEFDYQAFMKECQDEVERSSAMMEAA
jgi:hypothetical protein